MGSRTTSSITYGYGKFTGMGPPSVSLQYVKQLYQNNKLQTDLDFQSSLSSFGEKVVVNAARAYLVHYIPVVGDIYRAYQFARIAYDYYTKVKEEYETNGNDLNMALLVGAGQEIKEIASSAAKSILTQTIIDSTWDDYKQANGMEFKNTAFESVIKSALYDTMEEITQ